MTDAITPKALPNIWSGESLFIKSRQYAEMTFSFARDDWRFLLWSTFTLEFLARAALANVSPVLLADPKDWNNLLFALGTEPKVKKFTPRSISTSLVATRLRELIPDFDLELEGFLLAHMAKRNEELHSGSTELQGVRASSWLPTFYRVCATLLESLDESLSSFLGKAEAAVADQIIAAASDASAREVASTIRAHKVVWSQKDLKERESLLLQATTWARRQQGHRVRCPACDAVALLSGTAIAAPIKTIEEDEITERQQYLPARFECIACGLKISGLPQLSASGFGDPFIATFTYDAAEYYYQAEDEFQGYEPDFNEPWGH